MPSPGSTGGVVKCNYDNFIIIRFKMVIRLQPLFLTTAPEDHPPEMTARSNDRARAFLLISLLNTYLKCC